MQKAWPDWMVSQIGRAPRTPGYLRKGAVVSRYVRERLARGETVTHADVRALLEALERGYSISSKEVSTMLRQFLKSGEVQRFPNGRGIWLAGAYHRSIREAARLAGLGVETVRRKAISEVDGWSFTAPQKEN